MKSKIFVIIGILLITISSIFIIKDKVIEYNAGKKSDEILEVITKNTNDIIINDKKEMNTININGYDYIGSILIPAINIDLPVLDTWDYNRLNIAPCLYYGSIYTNNMIICGHSYKKHFKYLSKLKQGDYVIFTDVLNNQYIYEVEETLVLPQTSVDEMINNDFDLTLYTCTTDGMNRITIRCNMINKPF